MLPKQARGTFRKQITKPSEQVAAPPSIHSGLQNQRWEGLRWQTAANTIVSCGERGQNISFLETWLSFILLPLYFLEGLSLVGPVSLCHFRKRARSFVVVIRLMRAFLTGHSSSDRRVTAGWAMADLRNATWQQESVRCVGRASREEHTHTYRAWKYVLDQISGFSSGFRPWQLNLCLQRWVRTWT